MIDYMAEAKLKRRYAQVCTRIEAGLYNGGIKGLKRFELTTAEGTDNSWLKFQSDFNLLVKALRKNYPDIEYIAVPEVSPGKGLLHIHGIMRTNSYIPQKELSRLWAEIHGAKIVYIKQVKTLEIARKYITKHMVKNMKNCTDFGGKILGSRGWARQDWSEARDMLRHMAKRYDYSREWVTKAFRMWANKGAIRIELPRGWVEMRGVCIYDL